MKAASRFPLNSCQVANSTRQMVKQRMKIASGRFIRQLSYISLRSRSMEWESRLASSMVIRSCL